MKLIYELWDTEDSNLIGTFESEEAALEVVRAATEEFGPEAMTSVALGFESESGRMTPVATGHELVRLATHGKNEGLLASA